MIDIELVQQLGDAHLEQLPRLVEDATRADGHEPLGEHKFLRLRRGDDLSTALLAFDKGRLAGYAHTVTYDATAERRVSCEFVVDPGERRRGVGRLLLERAIETAREQGAHRIDVWAYNDSRVSSGIAERYGFTAARRLLHLHKHMVQATHIDAPEGVTVRAFRPGDDDEAWLALNNRIFSGHPENGAWTIDDLRARIAQPWFDAQDLLVLERRGKMAAFCWLKIEERDGEGRVGEIYVIGTAPEARGTGLGRYALARGLQHLASRGVRLAAIYVDESNVAAVSLYKSSGFHYHHVDVCYTLDLRAAPRHGESEREAAAA